MLDNVLRGGVCLDGAVASLVGARASWRRSSEEAIVAGVLVIVSCRIEREEGTDRQPRGTAPFSPVGVEIRELPPAVQSTTILNICLVDSTSHVAKKTTQEPAATALEAEWFWSVFQDVGER